MSGLLQLMRTPVFTFAVIVPVLLVVELLALEVGIGITLPWDRGSALSSYEIREKGTELHFVTRNKRFSIVDVWSKQGSARKALVLHESFTSDREDGIEGTRSTVRVEAIESKLVKWSFEESGDQGRILNQLYEVTKFGCCDGPNTYTYFSLRDGRKLRTIHAELNRNDFVALEQSLYY